MKNFNFKLTQRTKSRETLAKFRKIYTLVFLLFAMSFIYNNADASQDLTTNNNNKTPKEVVYKAFEFSQKNDFEHLVGHLAKGHIDTTNKLVLAPIELAPKDKVNIVKANIVKRHKLESISDIETLPKEQLYVKFANKNYKSTNRNKIETIEILSKKKTKSLEILDHDVFETKIVQQGGLPMLVIKVRLGIKQTNGTIEHEDSQINLIDEGEGWKITSAPFIYPFL